MASLAFSSDGSRLASGGLDGKYVPMLANHDPAVDRIRWILIVLPCCRQLSTKRRLPNVAPMHLPTGKVKIWDAATGSCLRTLEGPDEGIVWLRWHPRGAVLVAGSEDFTAWMWNADSGQCMQVPPALLCACWDS